MDMISSTNRINIVGANNLTITIKDFWSAVTHGIGALSAFVTLPFLLNHYVERGADFIAVISVLVFGVSMILLYSASTIYHTVITGRAVELVLKRLDHMMIFVLIAGSYTPICLTVLRDSCGIPLLIGVWSFALIGMLFKFFWVTCPKWISSTIYIGMGWLCVFAFPQIWASVSLGGFMLLLVGGIIYTVGGVVYALKLPIFNNRHRYFGSLAVFHIFVMLGNLFHFMFMYFCLV